LLFLNKKDFCITANLGRGWIFVQLDYLLLLIVIVITHSDWFGRLSSLYSLLLGICWDDTLLWFIREWLFPPSPIQPSPQEHSVPKLDQISISGQEVGRVVLYINFYFLLLFSFTSDLATECRWGRLQGADSTPFCLLVSLDWEMMDKRDGRMIRGGGICRFFNLLLNVVLYFA